MTRKPPRQTLDSLFQDINTLRKDIENLENRKNLTLPFRDRDNLPTGVEGQAVLADTLDTITVVDPCSTFPTMIGPSGDTQLPIYYGDYQFGDPPLLGYFSGSIAQLLIAEAAIWEDSNEAQAFPVWSRDFAKIAYTARSVEWGVPTGSHTTGQLRLAIMEADGTSRTTIYTSTGTGDSPDTFTISPDSTKIAWTTKAASSPVYVASTDGTGSTYSLGNSDSGPPIWSHDSQYVLWITQSSDPSGFATRSIVRRKWDASEDAELLMDGSAYPRALGTMHMHPYNSIIVFDYYDSVSGGGAPPPDENKLLGFLNVSAPGCLPEFITEATATWIVGDETSGWPYTLNQPMWSPDGRYILGQVQVDSPHSSSEYRQIIINRKQTFLKLVDVWGHPVTSTSVPSDGYNLYTGAWKIDTTGIWLWLENDWDVGIAQWDFPDGPITWRWRSTPLDDLADAPHGYVWDRQNLASQSYQGYWELEANPVRTGLG